jgi:DNA-binding response OmpR family regulator
VLLDIGLPDIDGFAVAERLVAAGDVGPAVVLISSREREAFGGRVSASSALGFVAKGDLDGPELRALVAASGSR